MSTQNTEKSERFTKMLDALGFADIQKFANDAGIPHQTIRSQVEKGRFSDDVYSEISERGGNVDWLLTGKGTMLAAGHSAGNAGSESALIFIDRVDVETSAREGSHVGGEEVKERRPFLKAEIARYKTAPENLHLVEVRGESMQPTFNPGDEVLVDHTHFQHVVDGIYAILVDGALMLKRIQHMPGGKLVVKSDNAAYEPFEVDWQNGGDDQFKIIGRVVWGAKRY